MPVADLLEEAELVEIDFVEPVRVELVAELDFLESVFVELDCVEAALELE